MNRKQVMMLQFEGCLVKVLFLAGHSNTVNSVVWTGENMIISGSNDREIRVWNADTGRTIRVLTGHAHWVNKLALSTAAVLRTGQFDHHGKGPRDPEAAQQVLTLPFESREHSLHCCLVVPVSPASRTQSPKAHHFLFFGRES